MKASSSVRAAIMFTRFGTAANTMAAAATNDVATMTSSHGQRSRAEGGGSDASDRVCTTKSLQSVRPSPLDHHAGGGSSFRRHAPGATPAHWRKAWLNEASEA